MYIRKIHAHVWEKKARHVSAVGSLLLAQDAAIFPVTHWQGKPQIEGQTVITTCRDSHPAPFSQLWNFHKTKLKMLENRWIGFTPKAYVLQAITIQLPESGVRHIPPTKENVRFTSLLCVLTPLSFFSPHNQTCVAFILLLFFRCVLL